jgi:hypothetical protein
MNIFNLFRQRQPTQVLLDLRHTAVLASLTFRQHVNEADHQLSADAGAELLYFLLHLTDVAMHQQLAPPKRAAYFDFLVLDAVQSYSSAVLTAAAPTSLRENAKETMLLHFNARQATYSRCVSFSADGMPFPGSKVFAFAFLVHHALRRTRLVDFDEILSGAKKIDESDFGEYPGAADIFSWSAFSAASIQELKLQKSIRSLK